MAGGEPRLVAARAGSARGCPGVDEWFDADLVFPSGATRPGPLQHGRRGAGADLPDPGPPGRGAVATNFILPHIDDRVLVTTAGGERVEHLGNRSSYTYQLEAFTAAVRTEPMPTDSDDAVMTMGLIDACYGPWAGAAPTIRVT